jgi:ribonucleotide reductase alpha subunit
MRSARSTLWWLIASATNRAARLSNMIDVPLRWPRITTRRLMALVAVVALAAGAEMTRRRGEAYGQRAAEYAKQEQTCQEIADRFYDAVARDTPELEKEAPERAKEPNYQRNPKRLAPILVTTQNKAMIVEEAKYHWEVAAYFEKLKKKYQHAARYAWLPVEADPPLPRRKR